MRTATKVATLTLIASGGTLLILGLLIWTGRGGEVAPAVHIVFGVVLVASLWTLCVIAWRAGAPAGAVGIAAVWGLVAVLFGLAHEDLMTGDLHWTIELAHLVVGMGAIWWGRRLSAAIRGNAAAAVSGPAGAAATERAGARLS